MGLWSADGHIFFVENPRIYIGNYLLGFMLPLKSIHCNNIKYKILGGGWG